MIKDFLLVLFFLLLICNYLFAQQTIPQDTLITLERNPGHWGMSGLSPCPFYKLTIFADGIVELEPKDYNEYKIVTGKIIKSRISQEQLKQLISEFEKIDFYSLKSTFESKENSLDDCPEYGTDAVTAIMSITIKGKTKQVEHYHGCRKTEALSKLTNLENKIDEIVNIKQWFDCFRGKNLIILSSQTNKNQFKNARSRQILTFNLTIS
ncbi:MAG: DUF6438 domain-containing protein [Pyrinomonadaceae bacterium]